MRRHRLQTLLVLCLSGVVLGTLGTWSWRLGHGYSAIWPALVVQIAGGIWFGGWGVLAAVLFPIASNALAHVGPMGMFGFIPANLAQGLVPAWAFRRFRMDPAIPGRTGILFYLLWGTIVPVACGALLGATATVLFGEDSWRGFPWLVVKWGLPHLLVSSVIGIPVLRIFTPLWRDLGMLVSGWWGLEDKPAGELDSWRFHDLPIQMKLVLAMCGLGLSPLLALSLLELRRGAAATYSPSSTPLLLTLSLVASIVAVGWLSREVVRPLLELREWVKNLMHGREVPFALSQNDEIGQVGRAFAVLLHDRERAEDAVRGSESRLRAFVENAPYGITRSSVKEDRFLEINPAVVKMLGYESEADVLALHLSTDVYADPEERTRLIETLSEASGYVPIEFQWKRKDGGLITVHGGARMIPVALRPDDFVIEGIEQDITERRLLEDQLRQAQKMEAVGRLAGGVAHDFNNLLSVILGYSELLAAELAPGTQRFKEVEAIRGAGERAAALTSQLLAFSRRQVLQPKVLNLNAIVSDTEKMLGRLIGEDIELRVYLQPGLDDIKADPGQIVQVIMNLAVNARDAMPSGGRLMVETKNISLAHDLVHQRGVVPAGDFVLLKVSDTGTGMEGSTRARIFEPFFTTKKPGEGTGLGLATVYGIVNQSAGQVLVHTELGQGTVFEVYFPKVKETFAGVSSPPALENPVTGSETILVVEDALALRELLRQSLEMLGFKVLVAASGEDALQVAARHGDAIQLLLTDVVMPQMNGLELARQIVAMRPEVKVICMSGYATESLTRIRAQDPDVAFIQKPFTLHVLAQKVREVLTEKPAGSEMREPTG